MFDKRSANALVLRKALASGAGHGVCEVECLVEYLVRPLVKVFRRLLECRGWCLSGGAGLGFELSTGFRPTGRVIFTNPRSVREGVLGHDLELLSTAAAFSVHATIQALGDLVDSAVPRRVVQDVMWRAVADELRHLSGGAVALLGRDHPLRGYLHFVAEEQDQLLRQVLVRIRTFGDARRADRTLPRPAVMVDLDFCALAPGEGVRCDQPSPGLARFVRDVENAGGVVVFNSDRQKSLRADTEEELAKNGLLHVRLLTIPDDPAEPAAVIKTRNLLDLTDLRIVAIFDSVAENRASLIEAFPDVLTIAVALAGVTTDWAPAVVPPDGVPVVTSFETLPRPAPILGAPPALSYAHSIADLQIGSLQGNPLSERHAVEFDAEESAELVKQLVSRADTAGDRTATAARSHFRNPTDGVLTDAALLHHVLTRKQFWRGSRSAYPLSRAQHDMLPFIEAGEPVELVIVGFPIKHGQSGLKARGHLPDLAELGSLVRLRELHRAASGVYKPGVRITVLTDGRHFRPRPGAQVPEYLAKLFEYRTLTGTDDIIDFVDIDDAASAALGADVRCRREKLIGHYQHVLRTAFADLDVTHDPTGALSAADKLDPSRSWRIQGRPVAAASPVSFGSLFRSLLHSVPVPPDGSMNQLAWSRAVFTDVLSIADPAVDPAVLRGRMRVLRQTWSDTTHYLAAYQADRDLGYDEMLGHHVRMSINLPTSGRCGFTPLGGSALVPWHGTGVVSAAGHVSTDFYVFLRDQGFVPVYSPLLSAAQPWFMVPVTATRTRRGRRGATLDPGFGVTIRLRRG